MSIGCGIELKTTVQAQFSEIKSSDNLRFSDYFQKTITYFTT